ncbi:acyl-CoA thioesterase/BAAT N-terminal domain-containing protein [Catenulispora subtropica]|uniref:Acyl-CoA thioester hydrolase/BAAT C-terminal domain-containing protein n=1 Tax=Catenulispora subtropica TaxID=450798 RepID=A0ABN2SW66_9ACTN
MVLGLAVGMAAALAAAGCGSGASQRPKALTLSVDRPSGLAYQPVGVKVAGADPGSTVTLTATAEDAHGVTWKSKAAFKADAQGVVDLTRQAPTGGSYSGVDPMGLFWSMDPPTGSPAEGFDSDGFTATITAADQGATVSADVARQFESAGETERALTVAEDGFEGHLFLPPGIDKPRPALIMIGGSDGGESMYRGAMLMASYGYPVLSVGYFKVPGTPPVLQSIPLEYFVKAATWLEQQPQVAKQHTMVFGASRGSEAALMLAQDFPDLIHGAVLIAPSAEIWDGLPGPGAAWTLHGASIAPAGTDIPVDKVAGPVLTFAGTDDQLWQSLSWARQIDEELDHVHAPYPHSEHEYQRAGHMVGSIPYLPLLTTYTLSGRTLQLGGTRQANSAAQAQTWKAVSDLLASLSG